MASSFKYGGYMGQILRVDLSAGTTTREPLREDWARDFVGGVGKSVFCFCTRNAINTFVNRLCFSKCLSIDP